MVDTIELLLLVAESNRLYQRVLVDSHPDECVLGELQWLDDALDSETELFLEDIAFLLNWENLNSARDELVLLANDTLVVHCAKERTVFG